MSSARPDPSRSTRSSLPHEVAADEAVPWSAVLHDVRGAATAIEALAGLVADDSPDLKPGSAGLLRLIQARSEQLSALCEAAALLRRPRPAQASLDRILPLAAGRLQKFLDRAGIVLKSPGEIPDRHFEAGSLLVLLQSLLIVAANARETSQASAVALVEVSVVNDTTRIVIELSGPGWGRPALEAVHALADADRCGELGAHGEGARLALTRMCASLGASLQPGRLRMELGLPGASA